MRLRRSFAKREDGTREKEVVVLHLFNRHMALDGGFRDNGDLRHDEIKGPVFCKRGKEV